MIKIRALRPGDLRQALAFLEHTRTQAATDPELYQRVQQLSVSLQQISQCLSIAWQFLPVIYIAVSPHKILGLIFLRKDTHDGRRWKIEHLILDPAVSTYDVGTQLVQYVINRYGGEGVQTFIAQVDHQDETALGLLKACGFRRCLRMHSFVNNAPKQDGASSRRLDAVRPASGKDARALCDAYHASLPPEARLSLEKSPADFTRSFWQSLGDHAKGLFFKRWVVEEVARDQLTAYLEMATRNYQDYYLNVVVHPGWSHLLSPCLDFAIQQISGVTGNARIMMESPDFPRENTTIYREHGFECAATEEILVKDYWIPLEDQSHRFTSPILLLTRKSSPAVN